MILDFVEWKTELHFEVLVSIQTDYTILTLIFYNDLAILQLIVRQVKEV